MIRRKSPTFTIGGNLWLLLIGVLHAFLLNWPQDILYAFALTGFVLYPFRKLRAESLIVIGLLCLAVLFPKRILQSNQLRAMQTAAAEATKFLDNEEETAQEADQTVATKRRSPHPTPTPVSSDSGLFEYEVPPPRPESANHNGPTNTENGTSSVNARESTSTEEQSNDESAKDEKGGTAKSPSDLKPEESREETQDAKKTNDREEADEAENAKRKKQRQAVRLWNGQLKTYRPTPSQQQERIERRRSNYGTIFKETVSENVAYQSTYFYTWLVWDVAGMMFIGMGLMKFNVFSAQVQNNVTPCCSRLATELDCRSLSFGRAKR